MSSLPRHTCLKLQTSDTHESIFVKGTWFADHFTIVASDGLYAWTCHASEAEVLDRAAQWDQPISDYIELAERYLGFQHPGSVYRFVDAGDGHRRLSWTFDKEGIKLEWRWKFQPSLDSKSTTAEILDFLLDANIGLSEEVVQKTQAFERLKTEAEKCLRQSERFSNEKTEFESAIYAKFLCVLNSKKAKLRELRDQLSKQENAGKMPLDGEDSTSKTESFGDESDYEAGEEEISTNTIGTSKDVPLNKHHSQKRTTR